MKEAFKAPMEEFSRLLEEDEDDDDEVSKKESFLGLCLSIYFLGIDRLLGTLGYQKEKESGGWGWWRGQGRFIET